MNYPKIIVISGSIRSGSINTRLAGTITRELSLVDCEVTRLSLEDYPLPIYNGDMEAAEGVPENAIKLAKLFATHDGAYFVCPEYNGSLTPLMKNTIDWISRVSAEKTDGVPAFRGKLAAIGAASPGGMGGMSMLYHLREILVRLGMLVISEQVALGNSATAFDELDNVKDERTAQFLKQSCQSLVNKASNLR
ncbi:MAG: NADPH-dependent FMN reductase [Pseudomonadota bacterium]